VTCKSIINSFRLKLGNLAVPEKLDLESLAEFMRQDLDESFGRFVSALPVVCPESSEFNATMDSFMGWIVSLKVNFFYGAWSKMS
jgi:hypothetical protein